MKNMVPCANPSKCGVLQHISNSAAHRACTGRNVASAPSINTSSSPLTTKDRFKGIELNLLTTSVDIVFTGESMARNIDIEWVSSNSDEEALTEVTFFEESGTPIDSSGDDMIFAGARITIPPDLRRAIPVSPPFSEYIEDEGDTILRLDADSAGNIEIDFEAVCGCSTEGAMTLGSMSTDGTATCGECGDDMEMSQARVPMNNYN